MIFTVEDAINILSKTPRILRQFFLDLPEAWVNATEGLNTFSPHEVLGHLILSEKINWIPNMKIILEEGETRTLDTLNNFDQKESCPEMPVAKMLNEFDLLRQESLDILHKTNLSAFLLELKGTHPVLGKITLRNLLSAWVAHDMAHIAQLSRIIAKQYTDEVGDFRLLLNIMNDRSAPDDVDYDWSQFVIRIPVKGTSDELFNAFTTPGALEKWFLREAIFINKDGLQRESDEPIMAGDLFTFRWFGWTDDVMENGYVLQQSDNCFEFTLWGSCIVSIKLLKLPQTYLVELTQKNMPTDDASKVKFHHNGTAFWSFYLTNLKSIMEGGLDLRNRDQGIIGVLNM